MHDHTELDSLHYLDNAATVFPKPLKVLETMFANYRRFGVNPGRSGYDLCVLGGDLVEETRLKLTRFFGGSNPERLCFASNASDALNILIQGVTQPGDHVVSTILEHNSVIRPVNHLQQQGRIEADFVQCNGSGYIDPDECFRAVRASTRAVIVNHGSNVIGTIQPIAEIGRRCFERDLLFIVDTAQTAGILPIDVEAMHISALAFTGHKSLLAPTGIGGLWVRPGVEVKPTRFGGTGVRSAHPFHLDEYPYRLEVGTLNVLGIAGLHAALDYLEESGIEQTYQHEMRLFSRLQEGLTGVPKLRLHGTHSLDERLPVLSFTLDGWDPSDIGTFLDVDYSVACRTGLQCAPLIHDHLGTSPRGTVRLSVGPMNTENDIEAAIQAVHEIARLR